MAFCRYLAKFTPFCVIVHYLRLIPQLLPVIADC